MPPEEFAAGLRVVVLTHTAGPEAGEVVGRVLGDGVPADHVIVVQNRSRPDLPPPPLPDPGVELDRPERNIGYARGMNRGMRRHLDAGAEWILLLTHDAEFAPGTLRTMMDAARRHPGFAVLGPPLVNTATGLPFSYGMRMSRLGDVAHMSDPPPGEEDVYACDAIDGAFTLLRGDMLRAVGLYDEKLFGYAEETELHFRARTSGWKVGVVRAARGGQDVGGLARPGPYAYLLTRNGLALASAAAGPAGVVSRLWHVLSTIAIHARRVIDLRKPEADRLKARAMLIGELRGTLDFFRGRYGPPPSSLPGMGDMQNL